MWRTERCLQIKLLIGKNVKFEIQLCHPNSTSTININRLIITQSLKMLFY